MVAARYLADIQQVGHGVVLFHDRVGDVGSSYAMDIAQIVIPALKAQGFVLVAPSLELSPLSRRLPLDNQGFPSPTSQQVFVGLADIDGDGRADVCFSRRGALACAMSEERPGPPGGPVPVTAFRWAKPSPPVPGEPGVDGEPFGPFAPWALADVRARGRASVCSFGFEGVFCRLVTKYGDLAPPGPWLADAKASGSVALAPHVRLVDAKRTVASFGFGDIDGDGKDDVCALTQTGIVCACSNGIRL